MRLKSSQKTHVPTEKEMIKQWLLIDVKGKTLGRVATKIADLLRGKGKPFFTPQQDCGDFVVVVNAKEIRLARNKMDTKLYHWHTRYPAGFRTRTARELINTKPDKILYDAVWGMLPRNRLRHHIMKKLKISAGQDHEHKAQNPKTIEV